MAKIDKKLYEEIGIILRRERLIKNISLDMLVEKLNGAKTKSTLKRYEDGTSRIDTDILEQICNVLGIKSHDVLEEAENKTSFKEINSTDKAKGNNVNSDNIIKRKRKELNLTFEELGILVGVGKSTVRKWENGMIKNMGMDKVLLLAKALGIDAYEILNMNKNDDLIENETINIKEDTNTSEITTGNLIKSKRIKLDLSMDELAKQVGVSKATVQRWESGEISNLKRDKVIPLAKALNINPLLLLGLEDENRTQKDEEENEREYDELFSQKDLGEKIKRRREELGISQEKLAKRMGYTSRSSINKIENGRPISQKIIIKLAEALEIDPLELMGLEKNPIISQINFKLNKLNNLQLTRISTIIDLFIDENNIRKNVEKEENEV